MRTITIKKNVYSYDDLVSGDHDDVKEAVLQQQADINVDHEWYDDELLLDPLDPKMRERRIFKYDNPIFKWKTIYFDLGRGQYIQFKELSYTQKDVVRKLLRIPKYEWENVFDLSFNEDVGRYGNGPTLYIEHHSLTDRQQKIADRAIELWEDLLHDAWRRLRDEYDYRTSEKAILETLQTNEYEFYKDGSIVSSHE